jgi:bifunctional non-homologous end joining protein LigD
VEHDVAKIAKGKKRSGLAEMPGFIAPQLCELVKSPPEGKDWVHEAKLDGYRMQLHVRNSKAVFYSRRGLDWTHRFPEIVAAGETLGDCIIDGEVCAVDANGLPSFAGLTDALSAKSTGRLAYYVFDMMWGNGEELSSHPLTARKAVLKKSLGKLKGAQKKRFSFVDHHAGNGAEMHKAACEMKLEGIVSKRVSEPYRPHDRSGIWTKAKCRPSQELVVAGWKMTGPAFRSLVVGAYNNGTFIHVGTVGTGYNGRNLPELMKALRSRETTEKPFSKVTPEVRKLKDVHWVKPTLVIEAEIASWTSDKFVRQASFKGLREDKKAKDVIVEFVQKAPD